MQVTRVGDRFLGSLTRVGDQECVPFTGVLELVAALERLTAPDEDPLPDEGDAGCAEVHDA